MPYKYEYQLHSKVSTLKRSPIAMEEADIHRNQKRIRNRLCAACAIIAKLQCKDHGKDKTMNGDCDTYDDDEYTTKCQSCQQVYDDR